MRMFMGVTVYWIMWNVDIWFCCLTWKHWNVLFLNALWKKLEQELFPCKSTPCFGTCCPGISVYK